MLSSAAGALVGGTGVAVAQDMEGGIGEVVVTAEKREQSIQDIPVSVTAVTSEQRDVVGITTIQDLSNFTPGMTRTGADRISLRGAGKFTFFLGSDPGVATYTDGFYSQNFTLEAYKTPMFVQRTELLRGPQGTLYGRNSMGGSLNVISARPTDELTGEIRTVFGAYEQRRVEGFISGPITDSFRVRASALVDQERDGFIDNLGVGGNYADYDRTYYELQGDWDVTSNLHAWLRWTTSSWDDTMGVENGLQVLTTPYQGNQYNAPSSVVLSPQYNYCNVPGTPSPVGAGLGTDECVGAGGGFVSNPSVTDNYTLRAFFPQQSSLHDQDSFVSNIDYDFGNGISLRYVTGYGRYNFTTGNDTGYTSRTFDDGSPEFYTATTATGAASLGGLLAIFNPGDPLTGESTVFPQDNTFFRQRAMFFSNELNLSNGDDEAVHWIVGLYQYHEKFAQLINLSQPNQPELSAANLFFYGDARDGEYARSGGLITTNSYAVFGQTDWHATDTLTATLGLRYTWDGKRGDEIYDVNYFNPIRGIASSATGCLSGLSFTPSAPEACAATDTIIVNGVVNFDNALGALEIPHQDRTWDAVTGTAGLQWAPDEATLVYGRYSRGYKAGGFLLGNGSSDSVFEPESVNAFEIGLKRDFGRTLRTNLAMFYNDYTAFQFALGSINPDSGLAETRAVNVDAETYGLELELTWQPIDDLVITANYSYLHSEITSACSQPDPTDASTWSDCYFDGADIAATAPGAQPMGSTVVSDGSFFWPDRDLQFQSLEGNSLPQAPENKIAVNANYTFHLDPIDLTLSATGFWTDSVTYGIFENPAYRVDSYSTADFRAIVNDQEGNFTLIAFVKNAFDEVAYTSNGPTNPGQQYNPNTGTPNGVGIARGLIWPRTYGVELQYHF